MTLRKIGMRVDGEVWDAMLEKAKEIRRSRNSLVGLIFEAVLRMSKDELINLIHPTKSPPSETS